MLARVPNAVYLVGVSGAAATALQSYSARRLCAVEIDACDDYVANDTTSGEIASLRVALADREENSYGKHAHTPTQCVLLHADSFPGVYWPHTWWPFTQRDDCAATLQPCTRAASSQTRSGRVLRAASGELQPSLRKEQDEHLRLDRMQAAVLRWKHSALSRAFNSWRDLVDKGEPALSSRCRRAVPLPNPPPPWCIYTQYTPTTSLSPASCVDGIYFVADYARKLCPVRALPFKCAAVDVIECACVRAQANASHESANALRLRYARQA